MIKEKITFGIDRKEISHFTSIELFQVINNHHTFKIKVPCSVIEKPRAYTIENAQNWLGKTLHIALENKNNFLGIITNIELEFNLDHVGSQIILTGYSKTILLESGQNLHSWEDTTLQDMVREIIKNGAGEQLQNNIQPEFNTRINYQTQYLETDFQYIQRLAKTYNEWLFFDGEELFFGKPNAIREKERIALTLGQDLYTFNLGIKAKPNQFSSFTYNEDNNKLYQAKTQNKVEGLPRLGDQVFEASEKLFNTASLGYGKIPTSDEFFLETILKKHQESAMADANYITATSGNNKLKIGTIVSINAQEVLDVNTAQRLGLDLTKTNFQTQEIGVYIITEITHKATDIGEYENSFKALPAFIKKLPEPQIAFPQAQSQQAIVIDNNDPKGQGRIKVKMLWQQTKNLSTPWIRVMTTDAGNSNEVSKNRGFVFIPEVGDHVMLGFRYNDPNRPYVLGSLFNGQTGRGGGANNDFRTLTDPSGHYLEFERLNNITLADKKGNKFHIDSVGDALNITALKKINLFAEDITLNATNNIELNSGNNLEINVSKNMIMNVMTQLFVFTPALKQVVSGFMSLFSGKALINSSNAINIEAKELTTHGTEKMLVHSDKLTTINSKEVAEMHGNTKNSFTNNAKEVKGSKPESISKAIVYFRTPQDGTYNGEFGFDWLRQKDNSLTKEPDYASIIISGYKDGKTNLTKPEAIKQLKNEYKQIAINRKVPKKGEKYCVPYLTLFSKSYVNSITDPNIIKPVYKAKLRVLLEIEEDLDRLEFEYDKSIFTIDKPILKDKTKTAGIVKSVDKTIEITCNKDIISPLEIKLYAYPKGLTKAEQVAQRTLAGKILVLKNDKTVRKIQKFVLIGIRTNHTNTIGNDKIGSFTSGEKLSICNTLHQALVIPILEKATYNLNISKNSEFQTRIIRGVKHYGKYIDPTTEKIYEDATGFFTHLQSLCFKAKNSKGELPFDKYKSGYFTVFSLAAGVYDDAAGQIQDVGAKNLVLFPNKNDKTISHEALHGLGLAHTHADNNPIPEAIIKYVFPNGNDDRPNATDNIMSYSAELRKSTWKYAI